MILLTVPSRFFLIWFSVWLVLLSVSVLFSTSMSINDSSSVKVADK